MAAPMGSVVTQASKIVSTILTRAVRLTAPTPNSAPTDTCVVETGSPNQLGAGHQQRRDEVRREALSGVHARDLPAQGLGDPAGVQDAARRHDQGDQASPQAAGKASAASINATILGVSLRPRAKPNAPALR